TRLCWPVNCTVHRGSTIVTPISSGHLSAARAGWEFILSRAEGLWCPRPVLRALRSGGFLRSPPRRYRPQGPAFGKLPLPRCTT
ncbi:MAG TPA: hypothetical protein PLP28_04915, partial [Flavobacteriales bacterium]|nr:hypothetical protein [Flavobacteriales bacterium]